MTIFSAQKFGDNELSLEEGTHIVLARFHGFQTVKILNDIISAMQERLKFLHQSQLPGVLLLDLTHIEKMNQECRQVAAEAMTSIDFDRMAFFGGSMFVSTVAKFFVTVSGKQDKIKIFASETEARNWLEETHV